MLSQALFCILEQKNPLRICGNSSCLYQIFLLLLFTQNLLQDMHLQVYLVDGKRVYTLKKLDLEGNATLSAHPARFSPDDKYSRERITIKRRFKVLTCEKRPKAI